MGKGAFRAAMVFLVITLAVELVSAVGNGATVQGDQIARAQQALASDDAARIRWVIVGAALLLGPNPAWSLGQMITDRRFVGRAPAQARRNETNITWDNILWDHLLLDKIRLVNILWDVTGTGRTTYDAAASTIADGLWTGRHWEVR